MSSQICKNSLKAGREEEEEEEEEEADGSAANLLVVWIGRRGI